MKYAINALRQCCHSGVGPSMSQTWDRKHSTIWYRFLLKVVSLAPDLPEFWPTTSEVMMMKHGIHNLEISERTSVNIYRRLAYLLG